MVGPPPPAPGSIQMAPRGWGAEPGPLEWQPVVALPAGAKLALKQVGAAGSGLAVGEAVLWQMLQPAPSARAFQSAVPASPMSRWEGTYGDTLGAWFQTEGFTPALRPA